MKPVGPGTKQRTNLPDREVVGACEPEGIQVSVRDMNISGGRFARPVDAVAAEAALPEEFDERPTDAELAQRIAVARMRDKVVSCFECAEAGYCRRGLDQEQLSLGCMSAAL